MQSNKKDNKNLLNGYKQIAKDFFYPRKVLQDLEGVDLTLCTDRYLAACNRIMHTAAKTYL